MCTRKNLVGKGKKPCTEWKNNNLMRHYGFFKLVSWQPRPGPSGRDAHVHSPWRAKMLSSPQSLDEQISLTSLCAKSSPRLWRPGTGTWFFFVSPNYPPVVPRQTGVPNTSQLRSECLPWKASSAGSSVQNIQVLVGRCNRWKPRFIKNAFGLKKRIMWDWNEKYILFSRTTATLNQKPVAVLSSGSGPPSVAESLCGSNIGRSGLAVRSAWPDVGGKTFVQQTRPKNQQNIMHRQNIWS